MNGTSQAAFRELWECPGCKFENEGKRIKCQSCGAACEFDNAELAATASFAEERAVAPGITETDTDGELLLEELDPIIVDDQTTVEPPDYTLLLVTTGMILAAVATVWLTI